MALSSFARQRPLASFFVLAYAIAWLAWSPLVLSRNGLGVLPAEGALWWTLPGSYAPLLSALIVQWLGHGNLRIARLLPSWRRFCLGLAVGVALVVLGFLLLPGAWLGKGSLATLSWGALAVYPYATARALAMAGPLGEEPGWRGFALPRLQARFHPVTATLVLGALWALWHLPLFLVPKWAGSPLWIYGLLVMGFCFVINLGFNLSRGSTLVAILLHAVFNASSGVLGRFLEGADLDLSVRPDAVLAGSFALIAGAIALAWIVASRFGAITTTRRA